MRSKSKRQWSTSFCSLHRVIKIRARRRRNNFKCQGRTSNVPVDILAVAFLYVSFHVHNTVGFYSFFFFFFFSTRELRPFTEKWPADVSSSRFSVCGQISENRREGRREEERKKIKRGRIALGGFFLGSSSFSVAAAAAVRNFLLTSLFSFSPVKWNTEGLTVQCLSYVVEREEEDRILFHFVGQMIQDVIILGVDGKHFDDFSFSS